MRDWLSRLLPSETEVVETPTTTALPFSTLEGPLVLYVTALSGGSLRLNANASARRAGYTDGRTIFLPPEIDLFPDPADARRLYRMMAAWKVLQVTSGALDVEELLAVDHPGPALALYEVLHGGWLDRRLALTWPGLAADLAWLRADALARRSERDLAAEPAAEALLRALLAVPLARLLDGSGFDQAEVAWSSNPAARTLLAQLPEALCASTPEPSRRLARELSRHVGAAPSSPEQPSIAEALRGTIFSSTAVTAPARSDLVAAAPVHYRGRIRPELIRHQAPSWDDEEITEQVSGGKPRGAARSEPIHVEARSPEQHQVRYRRASRGGRQAVQLSLGDREPSWTFKQVPLTDEEKAGALLFDEWDVRSGQYLREWCALRPRRLRGGDPEPVERILRRNKPLVTRLKQQFEALRPERLRLTRQFDGDDLDLNALVADHADRRAGFSPAEKLYSRTLERERNIALGCLVDLSGSTGAWIDDDPRNDQVIEVTRRALVFLCEALTVLDDRYAIFGFTGSTRKRCEISLVKTFDEPYGETIKGRIAGLSTGAYTRIGPAVRYTTQMLTRQPAGIRLLLLISDGRPNDFDGYGGRYGIEDTRRALVEARQKGVATFALTIDAEARDYMPHMFGRGHYVMVEDAAALATKLADIYRRLTVH